ncbi:MAG: HPr family phosphocarrier protein [Desulfobulbaceae bacterium]|nr:HPr family phosphocarrier protein [Desulfobulbaceae bacterium]
MKWLENSFTVNNPRGIHGRVATRLAEIATGHDVQLYIHGARTCVDCTSILDVLSLALVHGSRVTVRAKGTEADRAMSDVEQLFERSDDP